MRTLVLLLASSCVGVLPTPTKSDTTSDDVTEGTGDTGDTDGTDTTRPPDPDEDNDGYPISEDCDDLDPDVNPGELEICDGKDNDCDRVIDDQAAASVADANFVSVNLAIDEALSSKIGRIVVCGSKTPWPVDPITLTGDTVLEIIGVSGRESTVLLAAGGQTTFVLQGSSDLTLDGVTLTGAQAGPAITATGESRLGMVDAELSGNLAGGVRLRGSGSGASAFFTRTNLLRNNAGKEDGGAVSAEIVFDVRIIDSLVDGNQAANGGAVYAFALSGNGSVTIEDSEILNNTATGNGGAVSIQRGIGGSPTLGMVTAHFQNNTAGGDGGAIHAVEADLDFETTVIEQNGAANGAGIHSLGAGVNGDGRTEINDNIAVAEGGGLYIAYADVSDVLIQGNRAGTNGGGAYVSAANADDTYENVALVGNLATLGGGMYVGGGATVVLDSTSVLSNTARKGGFGGGVYVRLDEKATLRSESSSWGTPKIDDNGPEDVYLEGPDLDYSYDGSRAETFVCSIDTNDCT